MEFEGEAIDGYKIVLRQFKDEISTPLAHGELVELTIVAKVVDISHQENQRDGLFYRNHIVRVMSLEVS